MMGGFDRDDRRYISKRLNLCTKSLVSLGSSAMSWLPMGAVPGLNLRPSMRNSTVVLGSEMSGD